MMLTAPNHEKEDETMATFTCAKCGAAKDTRCKPKACPKCGAAGTMQKKA